MFLSGLLPTLNKIPCSSVVKKKGGSMKNSIFLLLLLVFISCQKQSSEGPPVAPVRNVVDEYWGVNVDDPYRYMENLEDPDVQAWFKGQADYAAKVLAEIPGRDDYYRRLKELDAGKPFTNSRIIRYKDGTLFYLNRKAGENIRKLYLRDGKTGEEKLLIDPESMKVEDNQHYAIYYYTPSPDKNYVVYGLDQGGSEETTLYILDLNTGKKLPETIDRIETAYNKPSWTPDSKGFFYTRRQKLPPDAPETEIYKNTKVYYHQVGAPVEEDKMIAATGYSELATFSIVDFPSLSIPTGSDYAMLKIKHGDSNELTLFTAPIKSLRSGNIPWIKICDVEDGVTDYDVHGNEIFLQSYQNSPRFKVVQTSLKNPDFMTAKDIVPPGDIVIQNLYSAKDALYVGVLDAGLEKILRVPYDNPTGSAYLEIPNDASGYVVSISKDIDGILLSTASWTKGGLILNYDPITMSYTNTGLMPSGKFDNLDGFSSKEVKVKSHDGVMVPLSIIFKRDIQLNGKNPTLVKGYGAYGMVYPVYFNPLNIAWLEKGGVIAVAHVRGGGEYGQEWHHAGQKVTKPNTWKDFIASAEYLISEGYTSKDLIAGQGGSAGGILIGRAITERPDLFAAAIINVGDLDALRAETTTNGVPNIQEFGTVTKEEEFHALLEMSSYHHVVDGTKYPAVLLTHGINDPRVDPWMSGKMAARLQAASTSGKPVLFRVNYSAGHGAGPSRDQYLQVTADEMSFLLWQFGLAK
jgi:prolyl oligopeptidase